VCSGHALLFSCRALALPHTLGRAGGRHARIRRRWTPDH
jgi:hypothetical protein